jgi:hypothetical protein
LSCIGSTSPNHDVHADTAINDVSHELSEMVTNPVFTAWYDSSLNEVGDKCQSSFGTIAPDGSNITLKGHPYLIQQTWSNATHACAG